MKCYQLHCLGATYILVEEEEEEEEKAEKYYKYVPDFMLILGEGETEILIIGDMLTLLYIIISNRTSVLHGKKFYTYIMYVSKVDYEEEKRLFV